MSPARVLALACLCACASADTRTPPQHDSAGKNDDNNIFYNVKSDAVAHTEPRSDTNNYFDIENRTLIGYKDGVKNAEHVSGGGDIIYRLSDEEYYGMPRLFHLDEYAGCLALQHAYCLGSFELAAAGDSPLFTTMQRYSANWVDNYNHTRLHRGLCLPRSCPPADQHSAMTPPELEAWFSSCVNASTMSAYNLSARLFHLDYCVRGSERSEPLDANERGFAALLAVLFGLAAVSTALDLTLADQAKKGYGWALSWSLRSSWRALTAAPPATRGVDLRTFDGLRVFCMLCVIIEHVCWLGTLSYIADTRYYEQTRRAGDVILMTNSTLVVQIFFLMASFLLAHKLLQQRQQLPALSTFFHTMVNRIIRISPSYFVVLWFAASWWQRLGGGPQWSPLVRAEADVCRRKWWTHLLYLNNVVYPDEKCLIQTWYLAADMQLYALALALTLALRGRRLAVPVLGALFVTLTGICLVMAYVWHLVPTYVVHRPESVRLAYSGDASFNVLYQSPLGNATGAVAGLLLAHLHHALTRANWRCDDHRVFRWLSIAAAPAALWWAAFTPLLLGEGPPHRLTAALLAALERPVFIGFVALALLGAINGIKSPWRTWLSHGGAVLARLSFGALLLHMPLNKTLLAARLAPAQLDRQNAIFEWFGVAVVSYAAALPLALLVELPVQRLYKDLTSILSKPPREANNNKPGVLDKTDMSVSQCSRSNS